MTNDIPNNYKVCPIPKEYTKKKMSEHFNWPKYSCRIEYSACGDWCPYILEIRKINM